MPNNTFCVLKNCKNRQPFGEWLTDGDGASWSFVWDRTDGTRSTETQ